MRTSRRVPSQRFLIRLFGAKQAFLIHLQHLVPQFQTASSGQVLQRYLESYPDNPFLISIRALGEAWNLKDQKGIPGQVDAFLKSIESFGLPSREVSRILEFMLEMLRTQFNGERWDWTAELWAASMTKGRVSQFFAQQKIMS